jgi:hypothetical protein
MCVYRYIYIYHLTQLTFQRTFSARPLWEPRMSSIVTTNLREKSWRKFSTWKINEQMGSVFIWTRWIRLGRKLTGCCRSSVFLQDWSMWLADRRSTCCRDGFYPAEIDETNPTNRGSERRCFLPSFAVLTLLTERSLQCPAAVGFSLCRVNSVFTALPLFVVCWCKPEFNWAPWHCLLCISWSVHT